MKMNLAAVILGVVLSTSAFAQPAKKMSPPPPPRPAPLAPATTYSSGYAENEITGNLGFAAGAVNLGVTYVKPLAEFGVGGYFFYQSSKDKDNVTIAYGITAIGALINVNVVDTHHIRAYLAPGFGLAIIKDVTTTAGGSKSDETIISPTFKIGVQYKVSPNFSIGLERMQFSNWFNDKVAVGTEAYSVAGTFDF